MIGKAHLTLLIATFSLTAALAQPQEFTSPVVHEDGRVTLRILAPEAEEVRLQGSLVDAPTLMGKNRRGIWSVTVGPLEPEIYEYVFFIDGAPVIDPRNPRVKIWRQLNSLVTVPGDPPKPWELQEIPHGSVHRHWYYNERLEVTRSLYVYTPPGYEHDPKVRYPVLWLLHGSGDEESAWLQVGQAHRIADHLLATNRMKPMLIVMPYGHVPTPSDTEDPYRHAFSAVEQDILQEQTELVNRLYRTRSGSEHRAIVGLSMGGGQSLGIGLRNRDIFNWVGGFSSYVPRQMTATALADLQGKGEAVNNSLNLLWIGCGKEDFLYDMNVAFVNWLAEEEIEYTWHVTEGGHEWSIWRHYLLEFLPLLFSG